MDKNTGISSVRHYVDALPQDRKEVINKLRHVIQNNLPDGFVEQLSYGMIGYVVPHTLYPKGYHCNPKLPLPFITIASQKNYIALYHMGIYLDKTVLDWFVDAYSKSVPTKLNMGKSCIRFKKIDQVPYTLLGELATKYTVQDWIEQYEKNITNIR